MITKFNFKDRTIKSYAIRKLTPLECFRLMGVRDAVIHIMQSTIKSVKKTIKKIFRNDKWNDEAVDFDEEYNRIKAETGKDPKVFRDKEEYVRVVAVRRVSNNIPAWEFHREDQWDAEWQEQTFDEFWDSCAAYDDNEAAYTLDNFDPDAMSVLAEENDQPYWRFKVWKNVPDDYIKKEQSVGTEEMIISASQQYKQAGNSIVVDVLAAIYEQLWYPKPRKPKAQLSMFDTFFPEDVLPEYPKGYDPMEHWQADGKATVPDGSPSGERVFLTTFSGYDSQLMAADALRERHPDFRWTCKGWSDIDKYACQMHDLVFPQFADCALGDITKIDWHKVKESLNGQDVDLFTYSSPCQDISQAGKQMGLQEGTGTRSALLWNVADAVEVLRPKYLLQENVAALVSEKFMPDFQKWLDKLDSLGYVNRWALLNAKDIGMEGTGPVPQNRLRVFCLSMRKDVAFDYQFPEPMPLTRRLEDILEPEVDERYFLKDDAVSKFLKANDKDTALFHQFALPPTHEDAMFLKTWLTLWCEHNMAWEKMTPTEMDEHLTRCTPDLQKVYDQWRTHGTMPSEEFKVMFEGNMKGKK